MQETSGVFNRWFNARFMFPKVINTKMQDTSIQYKMIDDFSFNLDDALMHKTQAIILKMIQMHILSIP